MGGGAYCIGYRDWTGQRESMEGKRYDSIKPLLEAQPYITNVQWGEPSGEYYDFSTFRRRYKLHHSLAEQQADHVGARITWEPWLTVPFIPHGRAVIARSSRYHNTLFPWRRIVEHYKNAIFVGLESEHEAFNFPVEYRPTKDLYELAQVIAGSTILFSNQTCAFWIGAGLGVQVVQESYRHDMNSIVPREGMRYTRNGAEINELLKTL